MGKKEVVDVWFDPTQLTFASLLTTARKAKCGDHVMARSEAQVEAAKRAGVGATRTDEVSRLAKDSDRHHTLKKSPYRHLDLSPAQATKVNAALGAKADPAIWLTPRQKESLAKHVRAAAAK